ncbi:MULTISPECIES: NAD(P)/FAD-dependent oxidoreductase [Rhodobacterales]|jgi:D-amino-acid dehydrogenase|uniref:NAD(P)/FAD-dependent oxidoreductase n=1 Tax=Rhodobacterales TaxID=204455 RepID=UPI00237EF7D0|nr:FAD-binding oxidoreductase [Phaeobacter gallaeciensis]MDE4141962.1 FAD-binding oxidoreductase [Phaeobacter gallaeciensis]MDE4150408.1 FAD-binding oxidoreductase [Phaeobacter gallaeciensis]MDE4154750.1 FAD-binding oxidoreductase [Phaeobacter gallaeciensis]MDE4230141.1 FAD-binding oxidoreductase [Phaeobacter gallaeciensis]MDE4259100.1 FAD-binding oxidoreductase [Phaeobacter gallaeciensis]
MSAPQTIVIGAGIVGAATAIWLRRAGHEVTLIDKGEPGMGASYGNGCILASSAIVPVTTPGLLPKGPKYLMDPNFPLFMRWSYAPKLVPWLVKYLSHANDGDTRRIAKGLTHVIGDSVEQHQALTRGTPAAKWVQESDYCFAYEDRAAFDADKYVWDLRREAGFVPELIEGAEVQEREPILAPEMKLLAVMKNHGYILNPGNYVRDLVNLLQEMGGRFVQAEVKDFDLSGGRISAVDTDKGRFECREAVLATGVWSKPLMQKLGLNVPLEAERGYHIVFKGPSQTPNNPMMLASGKFVATAMDQGLRCAGIVEFGGLSEEKSKAPLALLRRKVKQCFPQMVAESEEEWLGYRPAPSDSLPLIGEVGSTGVYAAFGHHHVGLTGGAKTGRMVADMIAGQPSNIDLRPYEPDRFA